MNVEHSLLNLELEVACKDAYKVSQFPHSWLGMQTYQHVWSEVGKSNGVHAKDTDLLSRA